MTDLHLALVHLSKAGPQNEHAAATQNRRGWWGKRNSLCLQAHKIERAVAILSRHGWWDKLSLVARQVDARADAPALQMCAAAFRRAGQLQFAKEAFVKLGDWKVGQSLQEHCYAEGCLV